MSDLGGFGLAHVKQEGTAAHPDDVYEHCGCAKCDERFRKQARAYYEHQKQAGADLSSCRSDPWFPEDF